MIQGEGEGCIDLNLVLDPTFTTLPMLEPQLSALIADARKQLKGNDYVYPYMCIDARKWQWFDGGLYSDTLDQALTRRASIFSHANPLLSVCRAHGQPRAAAPRGPAAGEGSLRPETIRVHP